MEKVAAVIVSYNKAGLLIDLVGQLCRQTRKPDEIIIVDNSRVKLSGKEIGSLDSSVRYLPLDTNSGSAGGYSLGIKAAKEKNQLIWLLDDDVELKDDSLEYLLNWLYVLRNNEEIGSWCGPVDESFKPKKTKSFAWRGTLIPAAIIEKIGLPRSDFFLYGEDTEYSLRMAGNGYSIYWIPQSSVIERKNCGRRITYRDPARIYYAFRNQAHLYLSKRRYFEFLMTLLYAVKVLLLIQFQPQRIERAGALIAGIKDGLSGRLGKNEKYIPQ